MPCAVEVSPVAPRTRNLPQRTPWFLRLGLPSTLAHVRRIPTRPRGPLSSLSAITSRNTSTVTSKALPERVSKHSLHVCLPSPSLAVGLLVALDSSGPALLDRQHPSERLKTPPLMPASAAARPNGPRRLSLTPTNCRRLDSGYRLQSCQPVLFFFGGLEIRRVAPAMVAWRDICHAEPGFVQYGPPKIPSLRGAQQRLFWCHVLCLGLTRSRGRGLGPPTQRQCQ